MYKPKVRLSKKELQEKYPVKTSVDVEIVHFTGKLFAGMLFFVVIALSVDIYHFTH